MPKLKISELSAFNLSKFDVSKSELRELTIAIILAAIIFAYDWVNPADTIKYIPLSLVTVTAIYAARVLVQKFVAKRFGCFAAFRLWLVGIIFAILLMVVGLKFAALGAVVAYPFAFGRWGHKSRYLTLTEYGYVAFAGPLVNIIFAAALRLVPGYDAFASGLPWHVRPDIINGWFALFTLLPIKPLEGAHIFTWKTWVWLAMIIAAGLIFFA